MPTKDDLKYFQAMPLALKIKFSFQRMREWTREFGGNGVYVSFSGGKDSTVLADLYAQFCKEWGYEMWLVFVNTGLEYPEIQKFVKWYAQHLRDKYGITVHLEILRPKMRFDEVIKKYGYPLISKEVSQKIYDYRKNPEGWTKQRFDSDSEYVKRYGTRYDLSKWKPLRDSNIPVSHYCCKVMKKDPLKTYEKNNDKIPIIATLAEESALRATEWYRSGCNAFDSKRPISKQMSFWTEQDVFQYIKQYDVPIASVYGDVVEYDEEGNEYNTTLFGDACGKLHTTGCDRTGCIFCAFGANCRDDQRFQRLKETHPRQYAYCIGGGEYVDGVWQPNGQGLGMGHVFDELNKIYGDGFIKY
jgi:3'-phosphoadenosine 5'-phosphosulfate sulfotransferase (PAPS reductase)/FAD synthetase